MIVTDKEMELMQEYLYKWGCIITLSKEIPIIKGIKDEIDKGWIKCKEKMDEEQQIPDK